MPPKGDATLDGRYAQDHWSRPSLLRVLGEVNALADCKSVLDVGCGALGFLSRVGPQYVRKYAIDVYRPAVLNFDERDVKFFVGNLVLDLVPVPPCDVVVATEMLEHV